MCCDRKVNSITLSSISFSVLPSGGFRRAKVTVHPRASHEGLEGEKRCRYTPSLTSAQMGWVVNATPRPFYPWKRPGTHCIGGWVGPRAGLDSCGKSRSRRDSIPGPSSPQRVAIPTELSRLTLGAIKS